MKEDYRNHKFTNGDSVYEWLDTLDPEQLEKALDVLAEMTAEQLPLNRLQVKIRMTAPRQATANDEVSREMRAEAEARRRALTDTQQGAGAPMHDDEAIAEAQAVSNYVSRSRDYYREAVRRQYERSEYDERPRRRFRIGKGWLITLGVVAAVLIGAFFTNPGVDKHKEAMSEQIQAAGKMLLEDYTLDGGGMGGPASFGILGNLLEMGFMDHLLNQFLGQSVVYHDYYIFSTCTCSINGKEQIVSIGVFGHIFTFDKKDVIDLILEMQNNII